MILAGNVGSGDDGELAPVDAAVEGDGADEPAGNRAAHRGSVPHALALHVVDVARAAQQLVHALLAGNGGANDAGCRMRAHGCRRQSPYGLRDSIQRRSEVVKAQLYAARRRQRARQHVHAAADPLGRSVFIGPMAHAAAAGNEQHGRRRNARDERRIVIGARHHSLVRLAGGDGRLFERGQNRRIAGGGRIGVDQFRRDLHSAARAHFVACSGAARRARRRGARRRCRARRS